jgi:formate hydrogenlyase subunit 4
VFALHLYVFVIVLLCVSLLLAQFQESLGGRGLASPTVDIALTVFNLAGCTLYIYAALGPAYGETGASRAAKACMLSLAVGGLFVAYRFAIFAITLYST